jgi:hypothetical protein
MRVGCNTFLARLATKSHYHATNYLTITIFVHTKDPCISIVLKYCNGSLRRLKQFGNTIWEFNMNHLYWREHSGGMETLLTTTVQVKVERIYSYK